MNHKGKVGAQSGLTATASSDSPKVGQNPDQAGAFSFGAHSLLRRPRPNVTTVMVQPTPYDVSEAECLAFTQCIPTYEPPITCSRSCVYEGPASCRCSVDSESVCALLVASPVPRENVITCTF